MASSVTFNDYNTVVDATWFQDINNFVYLGTFPSGSTWTPVANSIILSNGSTGLSSLAPAINSYLTTNASGVPQWTAGSVVSTTTTLTINGTTNQIDVSGGTQSLAANRTWTISIDSGYVGQSSITTLGTITTGVWTGTTIAVANGGTNSTTALTNNQLMYSASGKIVELGAMTDGKIVVGKTANAPQVVSVSGDIASLTNAGAFTFSAVNANITSLANLVTVGTLGTGIWAATTVAANHGGTGIANAVGSTITLGAAITFSGAFTFTGNLTATTSVTFPTSGTLVNSAVTTLSSLTSVGTIGTGVWQGTPVVVTYGGTGLASTTAYSVICGGTTTTGALQSVASVGAANQVLTSQGAGALPQWVQPAETWLSSQSCSSSASIAFTNLNSASYTRYRIALSGVLLSAGCTMNITFSVNNGTSYLSTNYIGVVQDSESSAVLGYNSTGTTSVNISSGLGINGGVAGETLNGTIDIYNFNSTANQCMIYFNLIGYSNAPAMSIWLGSATNTSLTGVTAIKIAPSNGSMTSGLLSLYGIQ